MNWLSQLFWHWQLTLKYASHISLFFCVRLLLFSLQSTSDPVITDIHTFIIYTEVQTGLYSLVCHFLKGLIIIFFNLTKMRPLYKIFENFTVPFFLYIKLLCAPKMNILGNLSKFLQKRHGAISFICKSHFLGTSPVKF